MSAIEPGSPERYSDVGGEGPMAPRRHSTAAGLLVATILAALASGCVRSARSSYEVHLGDRIEARPAMADAVSRAYGLDDAPIIALR